MSDTLTTEMLADPSLDAEEVEIVPELRTLLAELGPQQQTIVAGLLGRSLERMRPRAGANDDDEPDEPLDEISLLHGATKYEELAIRYEELLAAKAPAPVKHYEDARSFALPETPLPLSHPFERVMSSRASRRDFSGEPLTLEQFGTLLHYSWGIRRSTRAYNTRGFPVRFAPSAGGLQSIELYAVVNAVESLPQGLYHFDPLGPAVDLVNEGNMRRKLVLYCFQQEWLNYASVVLLISCVKHRVDWKYGTRAYRFMQMDAGFVGQNIYLVATALGLRTLALAGFSEDAMNDLAGLDGRSEFVTLVLPVGCKAQPTAFESLAPAAIARSQHNGRTTSTAPAQAETHEDL
jgi:SagB-type dehydrogenase family enzyme